LSTMSGSTTVTTTYFNIYCAIGIKRIINL
jgi:hypothetical protein